MTTTPTEAIENTSNRLGHRHVFGVLVPDFNSVVEPEVGNLRVPGVSNQTNRFALDADVLQQIGDAAEQIVPSGVRSWIIGLSTEGFPGGMALLDQGIEMLGERTGLPVHTASYASCAALELFDAQRIAILTPFDDAANEHVREVYQAWGFEVVAMAGLARPSYDQIANTPDEVTERAIVSIASDAVDVFVQVGGGLPMLHHIDALEKRLGRPIVAANVATYWHALRAVGIQDCIPGAGRLFEESQ
jgi:maleate isomerase